MDVLHEIPSDRPPTPHGGLPLGYLTHLAGRGAPGQVYRETIELAVAAEELGFSSFWVAQHHGGGLDGLLPSPLVLLAAIAERTSAIRLGTAVIAAALEDPLRLAEDAAVADVLSGGRIELGQEVLGEPRVAVSRLVAAGETLAAFRERWLRDPARPWATELIVQTQPAAAPFTEHLATLRAFAGLATPIGPTERTPVPSGTAGRIAATS